MRAHGWLLFLGVFFFTAQAQPPIRAINLNNRSAHDIYVWVTAATGVVVPGANSVPYQAADVKPLTMAKINFSYTQQWDKNTLLTLVFCTNESQSCLNTSGEYSSISIQPDLSLPNQWQVSAIWSAMLFPYNVKDNIIELDKMTWSRDIDFPVTLTFTDAHKKSRLHR